MTNSKSEQLYSTVLKRMNSEHSRKIGQLDDLQTQYVALVGVNDTHIDQKVTQLTVQYEQKIDRLERMYTSFRDLMQKSDLELRLESCNSRLELDGEPQGVLTRSLTESEYWDSIIDDRVPQGEIKEYTPNKNFPLTTGKHLTELGEKYHSLCAQKGEKDYIKREDGTTLDLRTDEQKSLAGEIVKEAYNFIYSLADKMRDTGHRMPNKKVLRIANNTTLSNDDLVHESIAGLIPRLQNYDPSISAMSTFVAYNAAAIMYRSTLDNQGLLRLPVSMAQDAKRALRESNLPHPVDAIMEKIEIAPAGTNKKGPASYHVAQMIAAGVSKAPIVDIHEVDKELVDNTHSPFEAYEIVELAEVSDMLLSTLTPRQDQVLRMRFGIGDYEPLDLEEIGEDWRVTRERIRQVEAKALRKMRHPSRSTRLRPFMDR